MQPVVRSWHRKDNRSSWRIGRLAGVKLTLSNNRRISAVDPKRPSSGRNTGPVNGFYRHCRDHTDRVGKGCYCVSSPGLDRQIGTGMGGRIEGARSQAEVSLLIMQRLWKSSTGLADCRFI